MTQLAQRALGTTLLVVAVVFAVIMSLRDAAEPTKKESNARAWANELGIEGAKISCDRSPGDCGCTVRYVDDLGSDRLVGLACCNSGCVVAKISQ